MRQRRFEQRRSLPIPLLLALLLGCGRWVQGPHEPYPIVPDNSGVVLANPKLVTITYASDPNASTREAFDDFLVSSNWFDAWRGEYHVGAATHLAKVRLGGQPPFTIDEKVAGDIILNSISAGTTPSPSAGDVLYLLYLPTGLGLTFNGKPVCEAEKGAYFGGYHWEAAGPDGRISFAVVPTCGNGVIPESEAHIEFSASHEIAEGFTSPFPLSNPAYFLEDGGVWSELGGELADICDGMMIQESGHSLQRVWSNRAAVAGATPCLPAPVSEPGFAASVTPSATQLVPAGQAVELSVQGWSTASASTWGLEVVVVPVDPVGFTPGAQLGNAEISNGKSTSLVIRVPSTAVSGQKAIVFLQSVRSPDDFSFWPELIQVQ